MNIRISQPQTEGLLQASKWLTFRVLLGMNELSALIEALPPFFIYNVSRLAPASELLISKKTFKEAYCHYLTALEKGDLLQALPPCFSSIWTTLESSIYAFEAKKNQFIIKPILPPLQLSHHQFCFSPINQTFHSMLHSHEAIPWGLQFSYPQIFSNSLDGKVMQVLKNPNMPNTALFFALSKWIRNETRPTPFLFEGKRFNPTFRIGKHSLKWAEQHLKLTPLKLRI